MLSPKGDYSTQGKSKLTHYPQVLLLARQLRADDTARGKFGKVDYDRKAVQIIINAREAVLFRWNYELPGQDQV